MNFSAVLLKWYDLYKRDLPWRDTQEPYRIWLSEIILQQTRVDQGLNYYLKFVELFPTVCDLAQAAEDEVMKAWQGLGYYSRARNLHATAKILCEELGGEFPSTQKELLKLKGVGDYTSAAIASFCFGEQSAVVDGNVIRVLSRVNGIEFSIDSKEGKNAIRELADQLIDPNNPGAYNQAIMEFGALQCVPKNPKCEVCPFSTVCEAYRQNRVAELPLKKRRIVVKDIWMYYFFIKRARTTFLRKRTGNGIWKGLYDFPSEEFGNEKEIQIVIENFVKNHGLPQDSKVISVSEEFIHILSHRKIYARFITLGIRERWENLPTGVFESPLEEVRNFGIPRLIDKFLERSKFAEE